MNPTRTARRSLLSSLEIMATGLGGHEQQHVHEAFARRSPCVTRMLQATARALRFGGARGPNAAARALVSVPLNGVATGTNTALTEPAAALTPEMQGLRWLELRLEEQVGQLRALLLETEPRWNIEQVLIPR